MISASALAASRNLGSFPSLDPVIYQLHSLLGTRGDVPQKTHNVNGFELVPLGGFVCTCFEPMVDDIQLAKFCVE